MDSKIADQVRSIYDRRPYPFGNNKALRRRSWTLVHEWVDAIGRPQALNAPPARVLVAGCGDGTEAFNVRRRLPDARIVAVDFSTRSIAIARRLQQRAAQMRGIRFVAGDLSDPSLPSRLGGRFDLIVCHGVLSYVPRPERALGNLARCLAPGGALYLGVNGSRHVNTKMRRVLHDFGLDLNVYRESTRVRNVLRLCDSVVSTDGLPRIAEHRPEFLASDIFGALNQSLTLSRWAHLGRRAGLHLLGNWASIRLFRRVAEAGQHPLLIPRSRAQVASLLERLSPSQFHRLLFAGSAEPNPPWRDRRRLGKWRVAVSRLYRVALPRRRGEVADRVRNLTIESSALNLKMDWSMPEWELELLRRGDGSRSLEDVLGAIPLWVPLRELRNQLYLLQQLAVITLLPPAAGA